MKHFLTGAELPRGDLLALLDLAQKLKLERDDGKLREDFKTKNLALLFEKPSLRTHMSFSLAMQELGGKVVESFSLNRKKEEPEDVGRVVEGYCDIIMLRTHEHSILERMSEKTSVPIINGLSDTHHPCQILADLLTLKQRFGNLNGLKLSYIGDGNNILHSLMLLLPYAGVDISYSCPKGYEPSAFVLKQAKQLAKEGGGKIESFSTPDAAVKGSNAIYTDVWTSMGFEQEEQNREEAFKGYQLNKKLYSLAEKDALVMHCLPMVKGKEITEEMAEHKNSVIFQQSENRLHAQKALLFMMLGGKL
jgi:ornithine carbamoyltransferase